MVTETEKIFAEFKTHSIADFFRKNRQMLGFSGKIRSLTTIVHELVTNSLDGAEEAGVLPDISVKIDEVDAERYRVRVEDNGSGIPEKHIGNALGMMLAGTKFHRYVQQRGQQGIGGAGCTLYAQITTGKPTRAISGYDGKIVKCDISIDLKTNRPVVTNVERETGDFRGLIVELEAGDVGYDKSSHSVFEYLKRTAMANPHAQITLVEPGGERTLFPRSVETVPKKPTVIQPHPLGIATHDLIDLAHHDKENRKLSSFLQNSFARVSAGKVKELREMLPHIDFDRKPASLEWAEAEEIVNAFKKIKWIAPATDSVIPIGKGQIEKSLGSILNPEFLSVTERSPKIYRGGVPFIVEAAIAYGGGAGRKAGDDAGGDIIRFGNRAPLLFDGSGCAITEAVKSVDWRRYGIKNFDEEPLTVLINFTSVHIPYTGAGKQALAPEEELVDEIKNATMEAARDLQRYLGGITRDKDRKARRSTVMRYVSQFSKDLSELTGKEKKADIEKKLIDLIEKKYTLKGAAEEGGEGG
jgi:DNA topoisomerase-6 subunit B